MMEPSPAGPAPDPTTKPALPAQPTSARERIEVFDVLRGFALYGVLLANTVQLFSGRAFMPRAELAARTDKADQVFLFLLNLFAEGKAMTLLTLLFGLGFALQLQRAETSGRSVVPTYLRRLAALWLIGVGHVLLLWWGDILWGYAIAGAGLLFFRRVRGRQLLLWAGILMLAPPILVAIPGVAKALAPIMPERGANPEFRAQLLAAITSRSGGRALTVMHVRQVFHHLGGFWVPYFPGLLGRFLIGYWAGTTRLFQSAAERLPLFRRLAAWGCGLGVAISLLMTIARLIAVRRFTPSPPLILAITLPSEIGALLLAVGYAAVVVLLMQRPAPRRLLRLLAPVGQMPLSTYLGQSLLSTFVFYGWGLGLATRLQARLLLPLTLFLFTLQIGFAHLWLSRFRFGPMEWLWRSLTYGRIQPLRRE